VKVISSWSGGKNSALACHKAIELGHEVASLMNFLQEDGARTLSHQLDGRIISLQAYLADKSLLQRKASLGGYEAEYVSAIEDARQSGARGVVFGDIDLAARRTWHETVCRLGGVEPLFPLWGMDRGSIMQEFVDSGFEAIVVASRGRTMGPEWLGRRVDGLFIEDLIQLSKTTVVDLSGEAGEYHTLVTAGPLFKQRMKVTLAPPVLRGEYWYADIVGYDVE
jgi:diphthine-ammonia ligase